MREGTGRSGGCAIFIGFPVKSLKRIQVGTLTLEGMKKGEFRELTPEEVASLESPVEK